MPLPTLHAHHPLRPRIRFVAEPEAQPCWADYGADFYAALSWANVAERRLWLAWMNCHRYAKELPTQAWRGAMTIPRELRLRRSDDGPQLLQIPVPELASLRGAKVTLAPSEINDAEVALPLGTCNEGVFELQLSVRASAAEKFRVIFRAGNGDVTRFGFDAATDSLFFDRSQSGFIPEDNALHFAPHRARYPPPCKGTSLRLRLFFDRGCIEVFVGDGELCFTEQILPRSETFAPSLFSTAGSTSFGTVELWPLMPATFA